MMDRIAVLIPCYNECGTIEKVVTDFKRVLPEATIYVYDNNSDDGSDTIAREAGAVVRYEYQQGKGYVTRRMFGDIDAECYLMVDADDTYPAECAKDMCNSVLERNYDMVIGDRLSSTYFEQNKRMFHGLGNSLVRRSINMLFDCDVKDIMTGYRAFSYRFVKSFPVLSRGFEIETEMTIHAIDKNMAIDNIVIDYRDRQSGSISKLNTYSDGFRVIGMIVHLFRSYRPFVFFGIIALILTFISGLFMIPIFSEYLSTGLVPRFPTLIVCGFIVMAAIQSLFSGIVLDTILHKNRQDFEIELYNIEYKKKKLLAADKENSKVDSL